MSPKQNGAHSDATDLHSDLSPLFCGHLVDCHRPTSLHSIALQNFVFWQSRIQFMILAYLFVSFQSLSLSFMILIFQKERASPNPVCLRVSSCLGMDYAFGRKTTKNCFLLSASQRHSGSLCFITGKHFDHLSRMEVTKLKKKFFLSLMSNLRRQFETSSIFCSSIYFHSVVFNITDYSCLNQFLQ